ncbi:acetate/propionate family kinase [Litorivicinus lipolyticus]|uniref:acetate/propionate family kinase n=1 Tax=Litorivicinus lipolyticus TaxID=418701 RepID=UPI003B58E6B0
MSEIWVINRGSSTLKLARYDAATRACIERLTVAANANLPSGTPVAIGHRVVHGGPHFREPVVIDAAVLSQLRELTPLAPLHQGPSLDAIETLAALNVPQIACFDTAFHTTQSTLMSRLPVPETLTHGGLRNIGFHGLSYDYIARQLGPNSGRWVALHLGSGASACALFNGVSQGTSMGFSPLDGLIMGTRPGRLDPGLLLHWWRQGRSVDEVEHELYFNSGLKALAGDSDMQFLLARDDAHARAAIDQFCLSAARAVGELAVLLGGLDGVVFSGGIGENAAPVRDAIAQRIAFMTGNTRVVATDEAAIIAEAVFNGIGADQSAQASTATTDS